MTRSATVSKLKATLSEHLARVKAGEEVIITERGKPIAKIVPIGCDQAAVPGRGRSRSSRADPLNGARDPHGRSAQTLVHEPKELPSVAERPRREEHELEIDQPLAVGEPRVGPRAPERAEHALDGSFSRGGVTVQLEAELHDRRQVALVEGDLPVVREPRHVAEQRLEEVGMEVAPRARDLLVEPAA